MSKVLLVDDEPAVRLAAAQALDLGGFEVTAVDCAEAALELLSADWPGALVTDVRLPGLDGLGLLRAVAKVDAQLPVVLMTGHGDITMAVEAMRAGAYDFIEKPFAADRLVEAAARAVDKRKLVLENRALRQSLGQRQALASLIGRSPALQRLRATIAAIADTDADVLVLGETGSGKEMVARALHEAGSRAAGPFVALNCGAVPETMVESELFGHEHGAFTGAIKKRVGRIAHASRGTLFLDEVESMPASLQVKLLRVLQERMVEPLGSNELVPVDVRVVAATKVDLRKAADEGKFREDLYYRLNVVTLRIPPLRERREDVPLLFQHFLLHAAARFRREPPVPDAGQLHALMTHSWPGNVRELKAAAERFVLGLDDDLIPGGTAAPQGLAEQVERFEKAVLEHTLAACKGNLKTALDLLGLPRKTFYDKLKRHGLSRGDFGGIAP